MLSTCANPVCDETFRFLRDGQLFRLQCEILTGLSEIESPQYFWLCARCSKSMSLRLDKDGRVIAVAGREGKSADAEPELTLLDRRRGLLLSCLRLLRPAKAHATPPPRRRAAHAS
jgi:hypothetical protein